MTDPLALSDLERKRIDKIDDCMDISPADNIRSAYDYLVSLPEERKVRKLTILFQIEDPDGTLVPKRFVCGMNRHELLGFLEFHKAIFLKEWID